MKKAFTLLEVVISITIFMIILLFIYKVLDDTILENDKFEQYITKNDKANEFYKIAVEDVAELSRIVELIEDKNKNSIFIFKSSNSYNNLYYKNITYMISSKNNLIRIESKDIFKKFESDLNFYDNAYIDVLLEGVKNFNLIRKDKKIVFVITLNDGNRIIFPTLIMKKI